MGKYKSKNLRKQWSQENLEAALAAIRNRRSQREVSEQFRIPRRTLRRYVEGGPSVKKLGRPSIFTARQEEDLVQRITRFCEIGMPLTSTMVRYQAYRYCERFNIANNFNNTKELAGKDWFKLFMGRHPELSKRRAQSMNPARAQKLNRFIVADHFASLGKVMDQMNLKNKPQLIYNMDEKGCRLTIHHQQTVLALKGTKRVHLIAPEHAENVTVVGCGNALGNSVPPMIIFKGQRMKPEFVDNLPPGSLVKMAPKGSMTSDLFVEFLNHLAKYKTGNEILLIFDGASSHLSYGIVEAADSLGITLYCLPSNTTHELQPLDKAVFKSFESNWDQELLKYWDVNPERTLNKARFNIILSKVWPKCMTPENLCSGFRATGIYPFNPSILPDCVFAPSVPTNQELHQSANPNEDPDVQFSDDDPDDSIPLASLINQERLRSPEDLDNSFKAVLPTPEFKNKKGADATKATRKKALNYRAQKVTKDLFNKAKDLPKPSTSNQEHISNNPSTSKQTGRTNDSALSEKESWYCSVCNTDRQLDMRLCSVCHLYFHEECVGLTQDDQDDFLCFDCE